MFKVRRSKFVSVLILALTTVACLFLSQPAIAAEPGAILGLPFSRFYSFEEIGDASRGARLGFDSLGRLAVTHQGSYVVLNDNTWIETMNRKMGGDKILQVVSDNQGHAYYGAFGSWGTLEVTAEGLMHPRPMLPKSYPKWVLASNFTDLLLTPGGVFFTSYNGVAYWNRATRTHVFFEVPQLSRIFTIHGAVFVWSHRIGIQRLDLEHGLLQSVPVTDDTSHMVDQLVALDDGHVLASTIAGHLMVFDGHQLTPWFSSLGDRPKGRIAALHRLVDGSVAVAINGRGLYVVSASGEILSSFTSPEYHRIIEIASREAGVLWVETENGVEKVLYGSALTVFGQRVGLPVSWPQMVQWKERVVVASGGRLYEAVPSTTGDAARFELFAGQPTGENWAIAASGARLLVGNTEGAFALDDAGHFVPVLTGLDVARLVMVKPDLCLAIGTTEIAALRWADDRWSECAPRVPGVGSPAVAHAARDSAWVELAANRVARIALHDGHLETRLFEQFPWEPTWINVGIVDDLVVLSSPTKGRIFFDEKTGTIVKAPELESLFRQAPYPLGRIRKDDTGTLWASYEEGLLMLSPPARGHPADYVAFSIGKDRFPFIHVLPGGDIWFSTAQSLYRVDRRKRPQSEPSFEPTLVSIVDGRTNQELFTARQRTEGPLRLTYAQNNLMFRFFAGSYAARRAPSYEFRLNRGMDAWVPLTGGSLLTLNDLREGDYRLSVRRVGNREPDGDELSFDFEIAPPWFRTRYAYTFYLLGLIAAVTALIRLSVYRTRSRNLVLEKMVRERTDELRTAMQQLNEETRNAATVAERNRLAGEIHDSLQQGLSGLILQLEATLKLPDLAPEVRSRLLVARNMVSFTRHEVQHAVWDMESPLLDDAELGTALHKIATLISPGNSQIEIKVSGSSAALSPSTRHHLLRMAQEAITNAVRHAAAKAIKISLTCDHETVALSITDDGNGFVPADVLSNGIGHFGLRGLRGRAAKIGGELQIDSAPGQGTAIRIVVNHTSLHLHATTS